MMKVELSRPELNALIQMLNRFTHQMTLAEQLWCKQLTDRLQVEVQAQLEMVKRGGDE